MRKAIAEAEVGDDVFGEDPTANRLQERVAEMLGKEAALFVASGTMGNEVSIQSHTRPGDEVICEEGAHCYNYEGGAAALLSGAQMYPLRGKQGVITAEQIQAAIRPPEDHYPRTRLIVIENTHNRAGGTIFPIEEIARIHQVAQRYGLKMHLDGARLWNASVATGIPPREYAKYFDSVSVCFSKGLGAPVGSAIAGARDFIAVAHRYRKTYGGGMRQVGILAAAALYALEHHLERLEEDHQNARYFAEEVSRLPGISIDLETVQTNIVVMDISRSRYTVPQAVEALKERGVLVVPFGRTTLRAVTHLDVSRQDVETAVTVYGEVFG